MQHVFGEFMEYDGGRYGMALLSRHPIAESANHLLPPGADVSIVTAPDGLPLPLLGQALNVRLSITGQDALDATDFDHVRLVGQ